MVKQIRKHLEKIVSKINKQFMRKKIVASLKPYYFVLLILLVFVSIYHIVFAKKLMEAQEDQIQELNPAKDNFDYPLIIGL